MPNTSLSLSDQHRTVVLHVIELQPQYFPALTRLAYVVNSMKGLGLLVGQIGAGKSTLARRMLDALPEDKFEAAL